MFNHQLNNKYQPSKVHVFLILPLIVFFSTAVLSETPEEKGLSIANDADKRDQGFNDFTAGFTMTLRNKEGQESKRIIRYSTLEGANDGDKSLIIFESPPDIKKTALLTFTHKNGPDDQWIYLPAIKRVKRISSSNKSGPFVGSEFAYEDLSSQEVEKYTYRFVKDDVYQDHPCFVVERFPVDPKSGYKRQVVWIGKDEYRYWKTEFYDRRGAFLKTLTMSDYNQYVDKYWRANKMMMINHQTGKSTLLLWSNYRFRTGLGDNDFNKNMLKRAR